MGDQHLLAKLRAAFTRSDDLSGDAREIAVSGLIFRSQDEWYKPRPRLYDLQTELTGYVIPKGCRANLRNREPTGRDYQDRGAEFVFLCLEFKLFRSPHLLNFCSHENCDSSCTAFLFEHTHDLTRRAVAE